MDPQKLFREFCIAHGLGETPTNDNTHPLLVQLYDLYTDFFRIECSRLEEHVLKTLGRELSVLVGFCSNATLNAFAVRYNAGLYFIGVNTGVFSELAEAFGVLSAEASVTDGLILGATQHALTRQQIVKQVAFSAALQFLVGHELGHIAHGHTDLLRNTSSKDRAPALMERNSQVNTSSIPPELYQAMEVDADLFAASLLVGQLARGTLCSQDILQFLARRTDVLTISSLAILVLFHLFYGSRVDVDSFRLQTHPLPEHRLGKFWLRVWQLRELLPDVDISGQLGVMDATLKRIPSNFRDALFPALRLEGKVNIVADLARLRANEDRFEKLLSSVAIIPVGAILY